jgi:hypothetical protein
MPAEYKNCHIIVTGNKYMPETVDLTMRQIPVESLYDGAYCCVSIGFYPYVSGVSIGIGCQLGPIMKICDGERIGKRSAIEDAFSGIVSGIVSETITERLRKIPAPSGEKPVDPGYGNTVRVKTTPKPASPEADPTTGEEEHPRQKESESEGIRAFLKSNAGRKMGLSEFRELALESEITK